MKHELLTIPERRNTLIAELIQFFQEIDSERWSEHLELFLRTFTGVSFKVPGPEMLKEISRDANIVQALRMNQSVETRVNIMRDHRLSYQYIENIWRVCERCNLTPPKMPVTKSEIIELAVTWMRRYPSLTNDIVVMFGLTARERHACMEQIETARARNRVSNNQQSITDVQRRVMHVVQQFGQSVEPSRLNKHFKQKPTRSIDALVSNGYLRRYSNGKIGLTAKGKRVRL